MNTKKHRSARLFVELARQKTAQSRQEIVGNIAELFLDERARLSDQERALMTGILRSLIAEVETSLRREISNQLSERDDVPAELKTSLARGNLEIAQPILMKSPALRSPELLELVRFRGREHRLAAAMRPSLHSNSGKPASAGGEKDVIEASLHSTDPELARLASDYLVAEAGRIDRLSMPALLVADLPADLASQLHWWVSAALRQHLLHRFPVEPAIIDDRIETATHAVLAPHRSQAAPIAALARRLIETLAESEPVTVAVLMRLVRAGRIPVFLAALSHFAAIPEPTARRIALQGDGESLALLCKASGVDREDFSALFEMLGNAVTGSGRLPMELTRFHTGVL